MIANMVVSDMKNNEGVAVVDPARGPYRHPARLYSVAQN